MTEPTSIDTPTIIALGLAALAGVETLLRGLSMILHAVAPRTKTTADDKLAEDVDAIHDKLDMLLKLAPRPPGAVPVVAKVGGATILLVLLGGLAISQSAACGSTSKAVGKTVLADAIECTTADRVKLEAQFGPVFEQALQRAIGPDGKIDLPSLADIGRSLEVDGWCVLEHEVARLVAAALSKNPSAPAAAAAPLDAEDLAAKLAAMRVRKFGATRFQFGAP
jgi:hypothetical protein